MLWDFLWVFWLLLLFFNIWVRSLFTRSAYFSFELMFLLKPMFRLFFFFTVLFYFFTELLSSKIFNVLLLYSNCYFWMSLNSIMASQISFKYFDFVSYSFIYLINNAEIELFSSFSKGDYYLWWRNWLLLWVFWLLILDFRLF